MPFLSANIIYVLLSKLPSQSSLIRRGRPKNLIQLDELVDGRLRLAVCQLLRRRESACDVADVEEDERLEEQDVHHDE
eukprot:7968586-Heterocapsa_arctica.AAC.1